MSNDTEATRLHSIYLRLWRGWMVQHHRLLFIALGLTIIGSLTSGGYTKLIQMVMNALETGDGSVAWWGPLCVVAFTVTSAVSQYFKDVLLSRSVTRMETDLQKEMFSDLVRADLSRLQREAPAALAIRFSSDISMVGTSVRAIFSGVSNVLTVLVTLVIMLTIDWPLTLMMAAVFSMAFIPVNMIGRRLRKLARQTQEEVALMTSSVTESLGGIRMARTYRLEKPLSQNASAVFESLLGKRFKQLVWSARVSPLMEIMMGFAVAVLLFVVARRVHAGTSSIADFTGLLTGVGVLSGPARRLGGTFASLMRGRAALDRVFALFDAKNTIVDGPKTVSRVKGRVNFECVSFSYPGGEKVLHDIALEIPPGQKTALIGRSGAGKSTVFNLLPRLYDPSEGCIRIDGTDIRDLTLQSLREQIAVVSQDSILLTATVAENIGFGRAGATREEIVAAAKSAAAHDFISALPKGYDTRIDPAKQSFSGGERQRLSIARSMLRDAPILLLDEATSALDAEAEAQIQDALARLSEGRTTLVIAHRLATIRNSDVIVVMDRGRIVQQGAHEELMRSGGIYADLFTLQFAQQTDAERDQ